MAEQNIPHGHVRSHSRGVSDGLLERGEFLEEVPRTHQASYRRGVEEGKALREAFKKRER